MLELAKLVRGTVIRADIYGDHFAVVLRCSDKAILVIKGTSRLNANYPGVDVEHKRRAGIAMGLYAPTRFCPEVTVITDPSLVRKRTGFCPPNVLADLEASVGPAIAKYMKTIQPAPAAVTPMGASSDEERVALEPLADPKPTTK